MEPQPREVAKVEAGYYTGYYVTIDSKFAASDGAIRNRKGEALPEDEPLMLFRARDPLAAKALGAYYEACASEPNVPQHHVRGVSDMVAKFRLYARDHKTKLPD
jgi:hypothetical protein